MVRALVRCGAVTLTAALVSLSLLPAAHAQTEQQKVVDRAQVTLDHFIRDPKMTWLQKHLPQAKAVLIAPEVVKAGFIFGGSGGRGVLLARDPQSGKWRGPVFYTLATASVGFQAGVAASENVTLVMTQKGLNTLLATSVKLGGDASVAAGPVGAGAAGDVTTDFVAFARSKGVYGGLNLDGTVITANDDWNKAYYGKPVLAPDVIVRGTAHSKQADKILADITKASGKASTM
ncbi:MAG TPA: lipid-binding SYLF domain-containing protein [Casimicrobiaceae bacterium]|nr:lipid-binding SYLF domain-containing protein [Casimicrobiaceae bacterium]